MASQQQSSTTPISKRDRWQTPDWLYNWANNRHNFDVDLAADSANKKCENFIDKETNSLETSWVERGVSGWCNPPYSRTGDWLSKAWQEAQKGMKIVMLVPTPNGENHYRDFVFGKASEVIFINGRIGFETPMEDGSQKEIKGNTRGSCFIVYSRTYAEHTGLSTVDRDHMRGRV